LKFKLLKDVRDNIQIRYKLEKMSAQDQVVSSNTPSTDSTSTSTTSTTSNRNPTYRMVALAHRSPIDIFNSHFGMYPFGMFSSPFFGPHFGSHFGNHQLAIEPHFDQSTPMMSILDDLTKGMSGFSDVKSTKFEAKDGEYVCTLDVSEDMIKDMKISEEDGMITICGNHTVEQDDSKDGVTRKSKSKSSFSQTLSLPRDAVKDTASAKYLNSKLELHVKRRATGRNVDIEHSMQSTEQIQQ